MVAKALNCSFCRSRGLLHLSLSADPICRRIFGLHRVFCDVWLESVVVLDRNIRRLATNIWLRSRWNIDSHFRSKRPRLISELTVRSVGRASLRHYSTKQFAKETAVFSGLFKLVNFLSFASAALMLWSAFGEIPHV